MIGYAGMTHLGIVSALAAAAKGFDVLGYDPDAALVTRLERGDLPIVEPGLPELLAANRARIVFSSDPASLARCDLVYVSVDVPIDDLGRSDLAPVGELLDRLAASTSPGATIVILSQVNPGYTRPRVPPFAASGRHLLYQVETLIFGRAVERALYPERYIVGSADPQAPLPAALAAFLAAFDCPVLPMRLESAELAKISINMFLTSTVTTTNMLAEVCEAVGAEWREIAPALRLDKRIGPHAYLGPGLGIGGTNLLRDMIGIKTIAATHGTDAGPIDAWIANSRWRRDWALRAVHREVLAHHDVATIAVWGLAYKENTASIRNSPGVALVEALDGFPRRTFDPAARYDSTDDTIAPCASALDACRDADVLAIMTPWPEFAKVPFDLVVAAMRRPVIIDPFGVLSPGQGSSTAVRHLRLGSARQLEVTAC